MAETTGRQYMMGALIFSVVLVASMALISPAISNSNADLSKFNNTVQKTIVIEDQLEDIESKVSVEDKEQFGDLGVLNDLIESTLGVFGLVWDSFGVIKAFIEDMSEGALGIKIPAWFTLLLFGSIIITIAFAIMSAWFKWRI